MARKVVQNCSSVGIIHRAEVPGWVFIETKTPGYPIPNYVGKGLLIGGNWVRPNAAKDGGPLGTYIREIREELTFGNVAVDPEEMNVLFGTGHLGQPAALRNITPSPEDEAALATVVAAIEVRAEPFGAFIQTVDRSVFDMGNPKNRTGDYLGLVSVFQVPLQDDEWFTLVDLQEKYGNLSNESQTLITSVWDIVAKGVRIAWGQDLVLQEFFLRQGYKEAQGMPLMPRTQVEKTPFGSSYEECMGKYEIEKIPEGVVRP